MRFGFVTCVELGLACMEEIQAVGGRLSLAITLRDQLARKKSGRIYLDRHCANQGIPLLKIDHVNDVPVIDAIAAYSIDWLFIVGWSQIAGAAILRAPKRGVLGMHPTLLPEGRGRAAIPWAILKGLERTGVTLFKLDEGVDTGPILAQEVIPLSKDEDAARLYRRVAEAHRILVGRVWADLEADRIRPQPQDENRASIWPARTPADGEFDVGWRVADAERLVRATTRPYPGARIHVGDRTLVVWRSGTERRDGNDIPLVLADGTLWAWDFQWLSPDSE